MGGCSSAQVAPEGVPQQPRKQNNWCLCCAQRKQGSSTKIMNKGDIEATKPTPEEAKSWENDFIGLLRHKYGLNVFQEFLRTQYGDENLNFWMAVEEYKKISDKNSRNDMARMIYEDYVSTLSPTEISLDAKIRAAVDKEMSDPDENTFQLAQQHIFELMHRDCLPRFLKSKAYKQLTKR
ncbi:regulator of G-protein signaling 19 [Exaiptasia diaphana]|uniref:RGS domain-containing protein n=1 Tax=Exaiptasia diaphana TaxID=2652724 RepID=A0A913WTG0_EXADI|nr:regulator of G-protein signaling 19 [Exaiptasia diaphana]XP_020893854.1 regulator of G-protein signaling 19 [Exaiptasia diaphana]KXJ27876.1 Regulator of G-protein signaling 19 [Exaiptasia diaphana]